MQLVNIEEIFKDILSAYHVRGLLLTDSSEELCDLDFHMRRRIYGSYDYHSLFERITENVTPHSPAQYTDEFGVRYLAASIPTRHPAAATADTDTFSYNAASPADVNHVPNNAAVPESAHGAWKDSEADSDGHLFYVCGPFRYEALEEQELSSLVCHKRLTENSVNELRAFYGRVPMISDSRAWKFLLGRVFSRLAGTEVTIATTGHRRPSPAPGWIPEAPPTDSAPGQVPEASPADSAPGQVPEASPADSAPGQVPEASPADSAPACAVIESRCGLENKLLDAIQNGDVSNALCYHSELMDFTPELCSPDRIRTAKNYAIALNSMFRKAVELAYVHPLYIEPLSNSLTREIESTAAHMQLVRLCETMIRRYCMLVQSCSRAQYSAHVRDCLNYIDFNYREPLSLSSLAAKFTVSRNYLSSSFHREVGMTITDYINTARVHKAIRLLSTTSMPMQAVSEECGFSDSNYFTRTFRKTMGMPPLKYRQSLTNL